MNATKLRRFGLGALATSSILFQTATPVRADHGDGNHYQVVNLVSDVAEWALLQDPDLVNAWGIAFSATSPFWISDNETGKATLYSVTYDTMGDVQVVKFPPPPNGPLVVSIPGEGNPTGQLFNTDAGTGAFNGDLFIFASEDGTISGWRGALGNSAETLVP